MCIGYVYDAGFDGECLGGSWERYFYFHFFWLYMPNSCLMDRSWPRNCCVIIADQCPRIAFEQGCQVDTLWIPKFFRGLLSTTLHNAEVLTDDFTVEFVSEMRLNLKVRTLA